MNWLECRLGKGGVARCLPTWFLVLDCGRWCLMEYSCRRSLSYFFSYGVEAADFSRPALFLDCAETECRRCWTGRLGKGAAACSS